MNAIDLIAYKVGKHIDDPKLAIWVRDVDEDLMKAAATKMIPRDLSDEATLQQFRKAQKQKNLGLLDLFNRRDPEGTNRVNVQDRAVDLAKNLGDAFEKNDAQTAETLGVDFDSVIKHGDPVAMAKANPVLFFGSVMKGFRESSVAFHGGVRQARTARGAEEGLSGAVEGFCGGLADAGDAGEGGGDGGEGSIGREDGGRAVRRDPGSNGDAVDLFGDDERVSDNRHPGRADQVECASADDRDEKDRCTRPATDCHNLQNLTLRLVEAKLGNSVKRSVFPPTEEELKADVNAKGTPKGKAKGMVLTRKLSDIGTKGLIGSFQGNVFDEGGKPTGKVFFTGDGNGQDSHSWLVVTMVDKKDGKTKEMAFDPVLGTKGAEVERAIDEQSITWANGDKTVAKTPGGFYLVREDKDCGPNSDRSDVVLHNHKTAPKDLG